MTKREKSLSLLATTISLAVIARLFVRKAVAISSFAHSVIASPAKAGVAISPFREEKIVSCN
jgi:hypothetical protein